MLQPTTTSCKACGKALKGRSDKKFCDDYCRNLYNNGHLAGESHVIRSINNTLRRNRRILERCLGKEKTTAKTHRSQLVDQGFQFSYLTHTYTNHKGEVYVFCYDVGYLALENNTCLVVKQNE